MFWVKFHPNAIKKCGVTFIKENNNNNKIKSAKLNSFKMCDCQLCFSNDDKCHKRGVIIKPKFTKQLYTNKEGC